MICLLKACVLNDTLYIHGGLINKEDKYPSNQLFKFDFSSGWKNISKFNYLESNFKIN